MRRARFLAVTVFSLAFVAAPLFAQAVRMGKTVIVQAGSEADQQLQEIAAATDPAARLALLERFLAAHQDTDLAILAYEDLIAYYQSHQNHDKVVEYAKKLLAVDPDNFTAAGTLFRFAQNKNDVDGMFAAAQTADEIIERFKKRPPPENTAPNTWETEKEATLAAAGGEITYIQYNLFSTAYQQQNATARAQMLERYLAAYPDSPYTENAIGMIVNSYQQTGNSTKAVEFAQRALERNPDNITMLVLLADYWSDNGLELDQAAAHAEKALKLLETAARPEQISEEDWQKRVSLQKGLALSALGQVQINKNQLVAATDSFSAASPLLKADKFSYARNLYRLGFTLARRRRINEARQVLAEAISIDSPYKQRAQETLDRISGRR